MVVIVDYGMGNLHSVKKAVDALHTDAMISSDPQTILKATKLILPGVGHFGKAMRNMAELGILEALNQAVLIHKTPILGICLGMQLMARKSEEGNEEGFGWFDAQVVRFNVNDTLRFKIPHTGWNTAPARKDNPLTKGLPASAEYYFVHSYYFQCNDPEECLCTTTYADSFCSVIGKEHIFGVQFHPEKSHQAGLHLLRNFINLEVPYNPKLK